MEQGMPKRSESMQNRGGLVPGSGKPLVRRARGTASEGGVTAAVAGDARAECEDGSRPSQLCMLSRARVVAAQVARSRAAGGRVTVCPPAEDVPPGAEGGRGKRR